MHFLIATPLYPPDTAPAAQYAKELAERLSKNHTVTVLTYGHLPEEIGGVETIAVPKDIPLIARLFLFTKQLRTLSKKADALILLNGPSTELPTLFTSIKTIFHIADYRAHEHAEESSVRSFIESKILDKSTLLTSTPVPRPEILPFEEYPSEAFAEYEASWNEHLTELKKYV